MRLPRYYRLTARALFFSWILLIQSCLNSWAADLEISLIPGLDEIGSQVETIQVYKDINGERSMFGLYDTGASVISVSADDQALFSLTGVPEIPILQSGGASAQGIDGYLIGDVSKSGTILADGLHAFTFDLDTFNIGIDTTHATAVPGIQAFVGTPGGSASLPSITGTPIHSTGMASKIDLQGYQLDFGGGLVIGIPDLNFVTPKTPAAYCRARPSRPLPCGSPCSWPARAITPIRATTSLLRRIPSKPT